jgi:hypothetical protein
MDRRQSVLISLKIMGVGDIEGDGQMRTDTQTGNKAFSQVSIYFFFQNNEISKGR